MCNFYNKNYILAALDFKQYYENHYNKKSYKSEIGLYNYIYCLYLSSMDYNLDQENSYNAIYGIYEFIKHYSNSEKIGSILIILNILLQKIEKKNFYIAKCYYNIKNYQTAFLLFKDFLVEYPNSKLGKYAFFYALSAQLKSIFYINNENIKKTKLEEMIIFAHQFRKYMHDQKLNKILYL